MKVTDVMLTTAIGSATAYVVAKALDQVQHKANGVGVYEPSRRWLENGPRPIVLTRGMGDADQSIDVMGCNPDICFNLGFPWVGRRWEIPANTAAGNLNGRILTESCYCKPVFEVGGWGDYITYGLAAFIGYKAIFGGRD